MFPMQKRAREEDDEEEEGAEPGNTADGHKKPRTLAFRTSPTAKNNQLSSQNLCHSRPGSHLASNMTPPESSEDEHGRESGSKSAPSSPNCPHDDDDDDDMDMVDAQPSISPPRWDGLENTTGTPPRPASMNISLETPPRESHEAAHGGRVPTPRWGHFRPRDIGMDLCDVAEDDFPDNSISSHREGNYRALLRRRRLPSPIGEDTAMMSSSAVTGSSLETLNRLNSQGRNAILTEQAGIPTDSTWHEGSRISTSGRTTLSMGYRADCEKCRTRVPGHYNHVIRT